MEEYNRYLKSYHSLRFTTSQFFCNIDDIDRFGFGFKELLVFQNLGRFLELKNAYDSSQVKAFYCVAERLDDGVSFMCQFKNHDVSLSPSSWTNLTGLVCEGVNIESDSTFVNYEKIAFVQSLSKSCIVPLDHSSFSVMQLKCNDRILHYCQDHFMQARKFW